MYSFLISIGFWGFMGLMYAGILSIILFGSILHRKEREAFEAYMDTKRAIERAIKQSREAPCTQHYQLCKHGVVDIEADGCPYDDCPLVPF